MMLDKDRKYIIAIDFDGTLTQNFDYPEIGEPRTWLFEKAKEWRKKGHKLILWTCRTDIFPKDDSIFPPRKYLSEAIEWCKKQGLEFDAVNQSIDELIYPGKKFSRKVFADFYIDDHSAIFNDFKKIIQQSMPFDII